MLGPEESLLCLYKKPAIKLFEGKYGRNKTMFDTFQTLCLGRVGRLGEQQCRVHDMRQFEEELAERLEKLEEAVKNREEM